MNCNRIVVITFFIRKKEHEHNKERKKYNEFHYTG